MRPRPGALSQSGLPASPRRRAVPVRIQRRLSAAGCPVCRVAMDPLARTWLSAGLRNEAARPRLRPSDGDCHLRPDVGRAGHPNSRRLHHQSARGWHDQDAGDIPGLHRRRGAAPSSAGCAPGGLDFVGVVQEAWPIETVAATQRLVGADEGDLPDGRTSPYVCPECGDLGCGAVTAKLSVGPVAVTGEQSGGRPTTTRRSRRSATMASSRTSRSAEIPTRRSSCPGRRRADGAQHACTSPEDRPMAS